MSFKRNQIETAIARIYDPSCQEPPPDLRTRIKRLLELDRSRGRTLRSTNAEEADFAFFSKEAPGTGADISFSQYEAFALLSALRIMDHGWTQGFAVWIIASDPFRSRKRARAHFSTTPGEAIRLADHSRNSSRWRARGGQYRPGFYSSCNPNKPFT